MAPIACLWRRKMFSMWGGGGGAPIFKDTYAEFNLQHKTTDQTNFWGPNIRGPPPEIRGAPAP